MARGSLGNRYGTMTKIDLADLRAGYRGRAGAQPREVFREPDETLLSGPRPPRRVKPVYPLAVSDPTFFKRANPLFINYLLRDTQRIAERLAIPFRWPRPDPIVQDLETLEVAAEQPLIGRLTRLAQLAAERGRGLDYVVAASGLLFHPDSDGWNEGDRLAAALAKAGFDLEEMDAVCEREGTRLDAAIAANREAQLAAGHWGAPLFVFGDEIFFGQDRIEDLVWCLERNGLTRRAP